MHKFTDMRKREWEIELNVTQVKRVLDGTQDIEVTPGTKGINLADAAEGNVLGELATNGITLCRVLWILVTDEAGKKDPVVGEEEFGRGLAGEAIDNAVGALLEELVLFSRSAQREVMSALLAKMAALENATKNAILAKIDGPELDKLLREQLEEVGVTLGPINFAGSSGESSESTPDPSHSGS